VKPGKQPVELHELVVHEYPECLEHPGKGFDRVAPDR